MSGLIYEAPLEFTGTSAPAFPVLLHKLPVAGALRRFAAKDVDVPVGGTVSSWVDAAGSGTALVPVSSQAPVLADSGGKRAVVFNGTNQGLQQSVSMTNPHSLVLVANILTVNTTGTTTLSGSYITSTADMGRLQTSLNAMFVNAGTAFSIAGQNLGGWRVYVVSFNGASTVVNINGTEYTGNAGTLPRAVFSLGFERGSLWSHLAVAESVLYNGALNATQRADLVAAMKTEYGIV